MGHKANVMRIYLGKLHERLHDAIGNNCCFLGTAILYKIQIYCYLVQIVLYFPAVSLNENKT